MRSALDVARNPQPYQIPLYMPPFPSVMNNQRRQPSIQREVANALRNYSDVNMKELRRLKGDLSAYRQEANSVFQRNVAFPRATVNVGSFDGAGILPFQDEPIPRIDEIADSPLPFQNEPIPRIEEIENYEVPKLPFQLEPLHPPEKLPITIKSAPSIPLAVPPLPITEEEPSGAAAEEEEEYDEVGSLEGDYDDESVGSAGSSDLGSDLGVSVAPPSTTDNVASIATVDVGGEVKGVPRGRINQGLATASTLGARMRAQLRETGDIRPSKDSGGERLTRQMISDASNLKGRGNRTPALRALAVKYGIDLTR